MILILDNYDSFVHNLARYFQRLGQTTHVVRNDQMTTDEIRRWVETDRCRALVLSPGPGTPDDAGICVPVIREIAGVVPILGVCLGHQAIGAAFGARIVRAEQPVHGRASWITHDGAGPFAGLPNPLQVGRYHSLVIDEHSLPDELRVTARSSDGAVMGVAFDRMAIWGLQFHPESVLTRAGYAMLAAFVKLTGEDPADLPTDEDADGWWGTQPVPWAADELAARPVESAAARSTWPAYPFVYSRSHPEA